MNELIKMLRGMGDWMAKHGSPLPKKGGMTKEEAKKLRKKRLHEINLRLKSKYKKEKPYKGGMKKVVPEYKKKKRNMYDLF